MLPDACRRLVKHLHYQVVDVSSIKVLCRRWFPQRARELPKKRLAHTAMSDVLESIEELRYYKHHFFGAPAQPGGGGGTSGQGGQGWGAGAPGTPEEEDRACSSKDSDCNSP